MYQALDDKSNCLRTVQICPVFYFCATDTCELFTLLEQISTEIQQLLTNPTEMRNRSKSRVKLADTPLQKKEKEKKVGLNWEACS